MRTILDKPTKSGGRRVVIELDADEVLVSYRANSFYRLAYPLDDQVMATHVIDSPVRVHWDSLEQKWLDCK